MKAKNTCYCRVYAREGSRHSEVFNQNVCSVDACRRKRHLWIAPRSRGVEVYPWLCWLKVSSISLWWRAEVGGIRTQKVASGRPSVSFSYTLSPPRENPRLCKGVAFSDIENQWPISRCSKWKETPPEEDENRCAKRFEARANIGLSRPTSSHSSMDTLKKEKGLHEKCHLFLLRSRQNVAKKPTK